ncbi:hypothetical protein [uncultured Gammaproteobacteria bacterium]|nr:hypothetical protein [uncultured Gammaproteobacteria bacterium]
MNKKNIFYIANNEFFVSAKVVHCFFQSTFKNRVNKNSQICLI